MQKTIRRLTEIFGKNDCQTSDSHSKPTLKSFLSQIGRLRVQLFCFHEGISLGFPETRVNQNNKNLGQFYVQ